MTKAYMMGRGILMDSNLAAHQHGCAPCRGYDAAHPETAALLCLEGSVLLKAELAANRVRSGSALRHGFKATKAQLAAVMKYK